MKEQNQKLPFSDHFLLNTGARIPAVGFGTWQADGDNARAAVRAALDAGYRHFDCAHLYGNEVEVGRALSEALSEGAERGGRELCPLRRSDLFITSKLWCTTNAPKRVETSLEMSLKNLKLSYLDLYLVHWPLNPSLADATDPPHWPAKKSFPRIKETWRAMERLLHKGLVKAIGVSNFNQAQIEELLRFANVIPAVNQIELHPFWRQDDLLKLCQAKGIHVSAHTPLGVPDSNLESLSDSGSGSESDIGSPTLTVSFLRSRSVHVPMLKASVVAAIADRLHKTPAQVILRWGLERGTSVLPRSLHPERIRSNFDILNWSLSDEDWNTINSIEPQFPLIDSQYSYLPWSLPLQAVEEHDDNEAVD